MSSDKARTIIVTNSIISVDVLKQLLATWGRMQSRRKMNLPLEVMRCMIMKLQHTNMHGSNLEFEDNMQLSVILHMKNSGVAQRCFVKWLFQWYKPPLPSDPYNSALSSHAIFQEIRYFLVY